jgi:outer membrane protein insertion porin family
MIVKTTLLYIFFIFSFLNNINSKTIILDNNNRLTSEDINNLTSFDLTSTNISENDLNLIIKDLVSSDLINNVEFSSDNNFYTLTIFESLFINEIYINGNIKLKNLDIIQNLTIKNKSFLDNSKIIYNSNIIENLYSSIGQQNVIVTFYLEEFNQNSFNLIYEVKENSEKYVSKINIDGNTFLSSRFIKSSISIKEKKFFTTLSISNFINENKINNSLSRIQGIYIDHGFFDISINYQIKNLKNKLSLDLFINEGARYKIESINFSSDNEIVKSLFLENNKIINKSLNNKFYDNNIIDVTSEQFNKELSLSNNSNLSIDHSYLLNDNDTVSLNFFATEQTPLTIKKLSFYGNTVTKDSTLRKQVYIKPGGTYNKRLIDKSINNLIRRTYIDNAVASSEINIDNSVDLNISLTEKIKSGNFKLGAGYSAQNGIATGVGLSDSNFYGTGNKINADLSLSSDSIYYDLSYKRFYLGNYNIDNTFRVFNSSEDLVTTYGYKRKSSGFDFTLKIPYKSDISSDQYFLLSSGYDVSDIYSLSTSVSNSVKQNSGKSNNIFFHTSYVGNTTNDNFNPTSGIFHKTTLSLVPTGISDDDYIKISSVNNIYFNNKINDNSIFILSKIGLASGLSNKIKTKDSFSLGGDFKGFQYSGIGPRDASLNYLGGTKMYQLTLGYSTPFLFDNSDTFIFKYFGTIGSVFDSEFASTYNSNTPRVSIGASLDIMTPIGPLSFSLASPISKKAKDKTQSYDFSIGSTF